MILSGWKEIAGYLHCGVRTVQRWEAEGLPIHRPATGRRSHVIADSTELDRWVRRSAITSGSLSVLTAIDNSKRLQRETKARILQLREHVLRLQAGVTGLRPWRRRQPSTRVARLSAPGEIDVSNGYTN